ncbi:hypothetical protein ACFLXC_04660 [Chloroflexota bacterium]
MQVQLGSNLYTLAEGQPLPVQAGQTLRVIFSFSYKLADEASVPLWASLYQKTLGIVNRVEKAQTKGTIILDKSLDWTAYQGQVDIVVGEDVGSGLYGLIVEMPGFENAEARIDDCIEVTGAPGMTEWLGPLMMLAVMGMMAQMMSGMTEGRESAA